MRIGCISDIHSNLPAFDAVLADMPPVDRIICAGDIVGYYPWPGNCLDQVRSNSIDSIMGNHDRTVVSSATFRFNRMAAAGVTYAKEQLTNSQLEWLSSLPDMKEILGGKMRIVHGHPKDRDKYTYPSEFTEDLLSDEDVLILGHTHVQGHRYIAGKIICNPGSVGQPRDGNPKAAYSIIDMDAMTVEDFRVEYDIDEVKREIESVGLPIELAQRLYVGN